MPLTKVDASNIIDGVLPVANGGTGATTQAGAAAAVLPSQTGNSGRYLTTDGTNTSWGAVTQTRISGGTTGLTPNTLTGGDVTLGGTLAVANGGTGLTTTPANGALDIGNGTGFTRATLTAGSGISITNGAGSITIASSGGGVTSLNGQTGAITNTSYGAIGSYVIAVADNGNTATAGSTTVAGSSLWRANTASMNLEVNSDVGPFLLGARVTSGTYLGLSGTWRSMTASSVSYGANLWVRIS